MDDRAFDNPVTGERARFVETADQSGGARTLGEFEIAPGGGVFRHRHAEHEERIEVLDGEIEVTLGRKTSRVAAPGDVVIRRGTTHAWRNPSATRTQLPAAIVFRSVRKGSTIRRRLDRSRIDSGSTMHTSGYRAELMPAFDASALPPASLSITRRFG